jgi:hypothetical protein
MLQEMLDVSSEATVQERLLAAWARPVGPLAAADLATGIKRPFAGAMHGDVAPCRNRAQPVMVAQLFLLGSASGHLMRLSLAIRYPQPPLVAAFAIVAPAEETTHAQATLLGLALPRPAVFNHNPFTPPLPPQAPPPQQRPTTRLRTREHSKNLDVAEAAEASSTPGTAPPIPSVASDVSTVLDAVLSRAVASTSGPLDLGSEAVHLAVATSGTLTVTVRGACGAAVLLRPAPPPTRPGACEARAAVPASASAQLEVVSRAHLAPAVATAVAALPSQSPKRHGAIVTAAAGSAVSLLPRAAPLCILDAASLGVIVHDFHVCTSGRIAAAFVQGVVPLALRGHRGQEDGAPERVCLQRAGPPLLGTCIVAGAAAPDVEVVLFSDRATVLCAASKACSTFSESAPGEWRPSRGETIVAGAVVTGAAFVVLSGRVHGQQLALLTLKGTALHCCGAYALEENNAAAVAACHRRSAGWHVAVAAWGGKVLVLDVSGTQTRTSFRLLCERSLSPEPEASAMLKPESLAFVRVPASVKCDLDTKCDRLGHGHNALTIEALVAVGTRDGRLTLAAMSAPPEGDSARALMPVVTLTVGERPVRVCAAGLFAGNEWRLVVASGGLTAVSVRLDKWRLAALACQCPLGPLGSPVDTLACLGWSQRVASSKGQSLVVAVATGAADGASTAAAAAFTWPLLRPNEVEQYSGFLPRVAPPLPPRSPPAAASTAAAAHTVFAPIALRGQEWLLIAQTPHTPRGYVGPATLAVLLPHGTHIESPCRPTPAKHNQPPPRTTQSGAGHAWIPPTQASRSPSAHLRMSLHATDVATDPMSPRDGHTSVTLPPPQHGARRPPPAPAATGGPKETRGRVDRVCLDGSSPPPHPHLLWASEPEQDIVAVTPWAPCSNEASAYAALWSTAPATGVFAALQAGRIAESFIAVGLNTQAVSLAATALPGACHISEVVILGLELDSGAGNKENAVPMQAHTVARCNFIPHRIGALAASSTVLFVAAGSRLCGLRLSRGQPGWVPDQHDRPQSQSLFQSRERPLSLDLACCLQGKMPTHATALAVDSAARLLLAMDAEHSVCFFRCATDTLGSLSI